MAKTTHPSAGRTTKPSRDSTRRTNDSAFATFVVDQLAEMEDLTAKAMFGGVGLYCGAVFFGIIARDVLYFKTDDRTRDAYLRKDMKSFAPYAGQNRGSRRYYAVPLDVLESPPALLQWARAAVAAASAPGRRHARTARTDACSRTRRSGR
jgi:DNA transformation protein